MNITKYITLLFLTVITFGACAYPNQTDETRLDQIPGTLSLDHDGIVILSKQKFTPDKDGVLFESKIKLPDFDEGIYYRPYSAFLASGNRMEPIFFHKEEDLFAYKPELPREDNNLMFGSFMMVKNAKKEFIAVLPLVSTTVANTFSVKKDGLYLTAATYGTATEDVSIPLMAIAKNKNPYKAIKKVWDIAMQHPDIKGRIQWRDKKEYPENFKYLGWCSWEHFKTKIHEKNMTDAINDLKQSKLPFRWVMIDDGYLDHESLKLTTFDTDKTKFPNGLSAITQMKDEKIKWMGVWRNFQGYMDGIHPKHEMYNLKNHITAVKQKPYVPYNGIKNVFIRKRLPGTVWMPKISRESSNAFYEEMVSKTKKDGFDILKVDFQSDNFLFNRGTSNAIKGVYYNNSALEFSCKKHNIGLLNCIAMHSFNVFNQTNSCLIRGSVDYKRTDTRIDKELVQNFYNAFWMGHLHWIDQDMFHTSHLPSAQLMSMSRAVAGGPVYLSDETSKINGKYLTPMMYEDGKLIRTLAPGVPSVSNITSDPYKDDKSYKIIAPLKNNSAAVLAMNLNRGLDFVKDQLVTDDYTFASGMLQNEEKPWTATKKNLLVYDFINRKAWEFTDEHSYTLRLREKLLFQISPIHDGWAVIGRDQKYMAASTYTLEKVSKKEVVISLEENGDILLWCKKKKPSSTHFSFEEMGNGLWKGTLKTPTKDQRYTISAS